MQMNNREGKTRKEEQGHPLFAHAGGLRSFLTGFHFKQNIETYPIVYLQVFTDLLEKHGRGQNEKSDNHFNGDWSALDVCGNNHGSDTALAKTTRY